MRLAGNLGGWQWQCGGSIVSRGDSRLANGTLSAAPGRPGDLMAGLHPRLLSIIPTYYEDITDVDLTVRCPPVRPS